MIKSNRTREALRMLAGESKLLEIAREVSQALRAAGIGGAVIGGVAVVLHGHIRTTVDVDVFTPDLEQVADLLRERGFAFDAAARQFVKDDIPVHLVTASDLGRPPANFTDLQQIRTVSLADLISMKLRSGTKDPLRAQDLADVIGLIRARGLKGDFAPQIDKEVRPEFRRLAATIARGRQ
jgi:hypothetical protein